jgi:hypothetical protein
MDPTGSTLADAYKYPKSLSEVTVGGVAYRGILMTVARSSTISEWNHHNLLTLKPKASYGIKITF